MDDILKDKRVVLIAPNYFGYEKYIVNHLELAGAKVSYIADNLRDTKYIYRGIYVLNHSLYYKIAQKRVERAINRIKDRVDYLIVIKGEIVNETVINRFSKKNPLARKILYLWDSVRTCSSSIYSTSYFDKIYSFDFEDCAKYSWEYRPLFYIPELINKKEKQYDISFIGVLHSQRVKLIKKLLTNESYYKFSKYIHLYNNRLGYYINKYILRNPMYVGLKNSDVKHFCLNIEETNKIYDDTKVLVDYTNPNQEGYTMRTIESIGHGCKLVTNNRSIIKADFYSKNNILIYDDIDDLYIDDQFINSPYEKISSEVMHYYSLDGWLVSILS